MKRLQRGSTAYCQEDLPVAWFHMWAAIVLSGVLQGSQSPHSFGLERLLWDKNKSAVQTSSQEVSSLLHLCIYTLEGR